MSSSNSLVEKLREHAPQMGHYGAHAGGGLMEQAADEIERLHAMLLDAGMQLTENARLLLELARRHHDQPLLHGMESTAAVTQPGPGAGCSPAGRGMAVNRGYIPTACGYIIREGSQQGEWIATFKSIDLADEYVRLRSAQKTPVHSDPTGTTREPPHCPTCSCGAEKTTDIRTLFKVTLERDEEPKNRREG